MGHTKGGWQKAGRFWALSGSRSGQRTCKEARDPGPCQAVVCSGVSHAWLVSSNEQASHAGQRGCIYGSCRAGT